MDAQNHPVRRRKEMNSADMPTDQRGSIDLSLGQELDREDIVIADAPLTRDAAAMMAFNEEPITIVIARGSEPKAPIVVDCWVNGIGAEVLVNGQWVVCGFLPRGLPVTTKRKYVEVLSRMKIDTVSTQKLTDTPDENKDGYKLDVTTSQGAHFSVIEDKSPYAGAWLKNLMRERA